MSRGPAELSRGARASGLVRGPAAALVVAVVLLGCGCDGATTETRSVHLGLAEPVADVVGVQYLVDCDDAPPWTWYVPLEDDPGLPEHVAPELEGWPFADLFFLTTADTCVIEATPMASPTEPSALCAPTSTTLTVVEGVTTEAVLVIQCESKSAAADVATLINRAPDIDKVTLSPGAAAKLCEPIRITPAVTEPDGDAFDLSFELIAPAGAQVVDEAATAKDFSFTAATPGVYQVLVQASDAWVTTEVSVDITVSEGDPVCAP